MHKTKSTLLNSFCHQKQAWGGGRGISKCSHLLVFLRPGCGIILKCVPFDPLDEIQVNWQILFHGIWCHKKFPGPNLTSPFKVDLIWADCTSRLEGWQHPLWRRMGEEKKVQKFPREMGYTQIWFHSLWVWWMRDPKAHKPKISIPIWRFYGFGKSLQKDWQHFVESMSHFIQTRNSAAYVSLPIINGGKNQKLSSVLHFL